MKLLEAVKLPGLYRLWNNEEKEVTEALFFGEISKSIVDDGSDWDPGIFEWFHEGYINFADWQEMKVQILPMVINDQG
ncbi:hypothetical protein ABER98_19945 [Domibacillus aminovorans]|uniref:hypothetical protein n=1 Tax=Domibacillus aminovorans TaxID=29332 RepID=UPI003D255236